MKILFVAAAALIATAPAIAQQRDSRGIPVMSETATPPAGANQSVTIQPGAQVVASPNQQAVFQSRPATAEYPPCARGQTDRCTQTYEGGSRATRRTRRR
jgi:hypothetical protein